MGSLVANPVAGANSPCDGFASRFGVDESFSTIRAGAGNVTNVSNNTTLVQLRASSTSNQFAELYRAIMSFNTAALTGQTITSATLSLYIATASTTLGTTGFTLEIVAATPAGTNNIVNGDFSQLGSTSFASKAYSDITTGAYNNFTLNPSGIAAINKSGVTSLGAISGWDLNNSFTGAWSSGGTNNYAIDTADNVTNLPILTVNFGAGGAFIFNMI